MERKIGATGLDRNPRIYDGVVDIACYEDVPEPGIWIWIIGLMDFWISSRRK